MENGFQVLVLWPISSVNELRREGHGVFAFWQNYLTTNGHKVSNRIKPHYLLTSCIGKHIHLQLLIGLLHVKSAI